MVERHYMLFGPDLVVLLLKLLDLIAKCAVLARKRGNDNFILAKDLNLPLQGVCLLVLHGSESETTRAHKLQSRDINI